MKVNAHHIPFKDQTFDSIFAGEIIEHLENPAQFLCEVESAGMQTAVGLNITLNLFEG